MMRTPATADQMKQLLSASIDALKPPPSLREQLWHAKAALKQAKKEAKAALRTGTPADLTRTVNATIDAKETVEQLKALIEATK